MQSLTKANVRDSKMWRYMPASFLLLVLALIFGVAILGDGTRRRASLEELATKIHYFHNVYDCFPPPSVYDANGSPMHSWRVMVVPFLQKNCFYDQYRLDESWDGPGNRLLHEEGLLPPVDEYMDPTDVCDWFVSEPERSYDTNVVMIVQGHRPTRRLRVPIGVREWSDWKENEYAGDGPIIVEMKSTGIHWMQPRDISLNELRALIADESKSPITGAAALSEGRVMKRAEAIRFLRELMAREDAREG